MADEAKPSSGPFDVDTVRELVRLMRKFDLSEIDLQDGDKRVKLRRGPRQVAAAPAAYVPQPVLATPQAAVAHNPGTTAAPASPSAPASKLLEIKSPMVGSFYAKPAPDKDDYVKVGSRVAADTVVCKVEAMKIFNDLPAGVNGTIVEVCVQNGDFVEYDQVLFRVEPT